MARIADIADAVVTALNGHTFSQPLTAARAYRPVFDLKDMTDLHVTVVPKGVELTTAGRAFVELFADDSKLVRGLRRAEQKLKAFGDSIRNMGLKAIGLGSAILAPLGAAAKTFADMGSRTWDMANRTGVSVETLSALSYAAEQSGAGVEAFENGIRRMQRTLYDAGRGLSTATDALGELGLTIQDLEGLSPEAQFRQLADRLDRIEDPSRKAALAMTIFGRSGTELLPMLEGGAAALDAYEKHARTLGLIMSTEDAAAADVFGDALADLWKVLKMAAFAVGAASGEVRRLARADFKRKTWSCCDRRYGACPCIHT